MILNRYITKHIILSTLLISLLFSGLLFFLSFLSELKNIGVGDYHLLQAMTYVLLKLPAQIYQFSPLCLLLGSLLALGSLSSHKELMMMRIAGFSTQGLMKSVFYAALFFLIVSILIGEALGPFSNYFAEMRKENEKNIGSAVVTPNGIWFHVDNNFIHIQNIIDRHHLERVTRYQFDDKAKLQAAYFSENLNLINHVWLSPSMKRTLFLKDRTKSEIIKNVTWSLKLNANLLNINLVNPDEMSLTRLFHFIQYLKLNSLQSNEYEYAYWQRIFNPFATLLMIFLAIPFVLNNVKILSMGKRILIGLSIGFVFFILNALLGQLSIVFQLPAFYVAIFPLVGFVLSGLILAKTLKVSS